MPFLNIMQAWRASKVIERQIFSDESHWRPRSKACCNFGRRRYNIENFDFNYFGVTKTWDKPMQEISNWNTADRTRQTGKERLGGHWRVQMAVNPVNGKNYLGSLSPGSPRPSPLKRTQRLGRSSQIQSSKSQILRTPVVWFQASE